MYIYKNCQVDHIRGQSNRLRGCDSARRSLSIGSVPAEAWYFGANLHICINHIHRCEDMFIVHAYTYNIIVGM